MTAIQQLQTALDDYDDDEPCESSRTRTWMMSGTCVTLPRRP